MKVDIYISGYGCDLFVEANFGSVKCIEIIVLVKIYIVAKYAVPEC